MASKSANAGYSAEFDVINSDRACLSLIRYRISIVSAILTVREREKHIVLSVARWTKSEAMNVINYIILYLSSFQNISISLLFILYLPSFQNIFSLFYGATKFGGSHELRTHNDLGLHVLTKSVPQRSRKLYQPDSPPIQIFTESTQPSSVTTMIPLAITDVISITFSARSTGKIRDRRDCSEVFGRVGSFLRSRPYGTPTLVIR